MQIFCLAKFHLSFGEEERRHLLLVPGLKRVGFCWVSFIYILGYFWVIRIFISLSVIYEDKREKLTKQQFWALRYKKGTDRGKRRLKYTDLVKDGLKNGYFIVFLILIWATLSSSTGESGVEIYWF